MQCPKCRGAMRTYNRNGVHIDQCDQCRGIFLDYGELEALARVETQWVQPAPPPPPPAHGGHGYAQPHHGHHGHHRQKSMFGMLFSS
ncbi:zf-TFIIB domain-containing protein [Actinomadura alba]|uniref:Zf-TFIIB domain-containing protein n=1 Tax=Actinomadura alba TaxID=406431 RepID=A0ABR7LJG2_9ACTN|nr:zf-TFIIB domain-containing protein [Actinomadura alba]MBC6464987.1 zf-TFIIB domain-containing protein [Actinomadura alba]